MRLPLKLTAKSVAVALWATRRACVERMGRALPTGKRLQRVPARLRQKGSLAEDIGLITRQDAWRRSRAVGGKPRTSVAPIFRCNDQMAWCPGAAPQ